MAEDLYHRYEFTFIVQMLTVSQEQAIEESLGGRVEDRRGLQLLTLTSEGMRAATTAITVVDQLVAAGVRPQRTSRSGVTSGHCRPCGGDAASCRAVGARGPAGGYALPDSVQLGCRGIWFWGDVLDWLRRQGYSQDTGLRYPTLDEHIRIDRHIAINHKTVG
ncbi:hypothetical protein ACETU7_04030 [Rhodococcus sp. 3Y1]